MEGLTEGRIVHYVLPDGPHAGEHRPAIVVKAWRRVIDESGEPKAPPDGYSNLVVFMDGTNDGPHGCTYWATSVTFSEEPKPRTWHWIEKA